MNDKEVHDVSWRQRFDVSDFSIRWQRARLSALSIGADIEVCLSKDFAAVEWEALQKISLSDREKILKAVFDQSRKLGLSLSKNLRLFFEPSDFQFLFSEIESPCIRGQWTQGQAVKKASHALPIGDVKTKQELPVVLNRLGCNEAKALGSFYCDYWRESLDGLVMGLGESERLARHRSRGHGDDYCQDVIFSEDTDISVPIRKNAAEDNITKGIDSKPRFGPLPSEWLPKLDKVRSRFEATRIFVDFKGYSEGTIYFSIQSNEGPLCGSGGSLIRKALEEEVKAKLEYNGFFKDISPLAVLGTGV